VDRVESAEDEGEQRERARQVAVAFAADLVVEFRFGADVLFAQGGLHVAERAEEFILDLGHEEVGGELGGALRRQRAEILPRALEVLPSALQQERRGG
jgi:hypothetical protein